MNAPDQTPPATQDTGHCLVALDGRRSAMRAVVRTYPRYLGSLLATAVLPLMPVALALQALHLGTLRDAVIVDGQVQSFSFLGDPVFAPAADALTVLAALCAPVSLGAGLTVAATALLDRRIDVRAAWRHSLRRYPTTFLLLLLCGAAAYTLWSVVRRFPFEALEIWPALLTLLSPLLLMACPFLAVAVPLSLLEGRGPVRTLWDAWWMGRHRRVTHLCAVVVSGTVVYLGALGGRAVAVHGTGVTEDDPLALTGMLLGVSLTFPLGLLALSVPVVSSRASPLHEPEEVAHSVHSPVVTFPETRINVRGNPLRYVKTTRVRPPGRKTTDIEVRDLDLARVHTLVPGPRPQQQVSPTAAGASAMVVLLPLAAGPVMMAQAPVTTAGITVEPLRFEEDPIRLRIHLEDGGAVVDSTASQPPSFVCDPECTSRALSAGDGEQHRFTAPDGTSAWIAWSEDDALALPGEAPHEQEGLYLHSCFPEKGCSDKTSTLLRPSDGSSGFSGSTAVAPLADEGLVVVSAIAPEHAELPREALQAHACEDVRCEDPKHVQLPREAVVDPADGDTASLDVASSPDGGFLVSTLDSGYGSLRLVHCADGDCADPEATEVFPEQFRARFDDHDRALGAQVEYRSDGTPVVVYRDVADGTVTALDCQNAACSEYEEQELTGPSWPRTTPGFALDSSDRPQIATHDDRRERLMLISCTDQGCTDTVDTLLAAHGDTTGRTALALDEQDRPYIAWKGLPGAEKSSRNDPDEGAPRSALVRCERPLCGAVLD